jgi:hypothetical protein
MSVVRTQGGHSTPDSEASDLARESVIDSETAQRSSADVARYVSHMTSELAAMSRAAQFDLLAYFLDMARIEANIQAQRFTAQPGGSETLLPP